MMRQNKRAIEIIYNHNEDIIVCFGDTRIKYTYNKSFDAYRYAICFENAFYCMTEDFNDFMTKRLITKIETLDGAEIYNREKYKQYFYKLLKKHIEQWSVYNRIAWHPKRLERLGYFEEV